MADSFEGSIEAPAGGNQSNDPFGGGNIGADAGGGPSSLDAMAFGGSAIGGTMVGAAGVVAGLATGPATAIGIAFGTLEFMASSPFARDVISQATIDINQVAPGINIADSSTFDTSGAAAGGDPYAPWGGYWAYMGIQT